MTERPAEAHTGFTELTANTIPINPTLESGRINTHCFLLTALPRCSAPCSCEKASEATFRPHIRHLKPKQTTPTARVHGLCVMEALTASSLKKANPLCRVLITSPAFSSVQSEINSTVTHFTVGSELKHV